MLIYLDRSVFILAFFSCWPCFAQMTSVNTDTVLANECFAKAQKLEEYTEFDSAMVYFEKSAEIFKNASVELDDLRLFAKYIDCLTSAGRMSRLKDNKDKAAAYLENILKIGLEKFKETDLELAKLYLQLGRASSKKDEDKLIKAKKYLDQSLQIRMKFLEPSHTDLGENYHAFGIYYLSIDEFDKAETFIEKAKEIWINAYGEFHGDVANIYQDLGWSST